MKTTSDIPSCELNWLGLTLGPLLWVKHYIGELGDRLQGMIWDELIHNRVEESQFTHLAAFLMFSAFCLWAHYQDMLPYVDAVLAALLPMQFLVDRYGFSTRRAGKASLEIQPERMAWAWRDGKDTANGQFVKADIAAIVIRRAHAPQRFGLEAELGWDVLIRLRAKDQDYLLHREADWDTAWEQAAALARNFGVPLKVADSLGLGAAAEKEVPPIQPAHHDFAWHAQGMSGGAKIQRNWKTLRGLARLRSLLDEGGYLLFVAVLDTVMAKYGAFLVWMLGPRLGLTEPTTLYFDFSFGGLFGFFVPEWTVRQSVLVMAALAAAGFGWYRQSRPQELTVSERNVFYRRDGYPAQMLPTAEISQLLMVFAPRPLLLVWSENRAPLVVDGLHDDGELDEVYAKLLAELRKLRPDDGRSRRFEM